MKKCLLYLFTLLFIARLHAADYYWVGGGGSWSDLNHWRLGSSGGPIPSIIPSPGDNVFFDANSGFGTTLATRTITVDANGFCNNMTWSNTVPNNPRFITANSAFTIEVWGNLSLSPTATYSVIFAFKGATANTITSNGNVLGEFGMVIDKAGGSLTVVDSLVQTTLTNSLGTNSTTVTRGVFNMAGKRLSGHMFYSQNDNVRTLEMTNANLTYNFQFRVTGLNKTINASGSTVTALSYLFTDGGTYNRVIGGGGGLNNQIGINNTILSSLYFTLANVNSQARLGNGNTVTDSLVFAGAGGFAGNNTVNKVFFGMPAFISGTNNTVNKITCQGDFQVNGNFTNTVDSMLLAANHLSSFRGTFNINKYLYVDGAPCEAFTDINGDSTTGSLNFAPGAVVDLSNVILTGVKAYGPVTPITVDGIDGDNNVGFTIIPPATTTGVTLYWVGGSGDWNDRAHWSTSSGGTGGACVPFMNDDVIFDINSGLASGTVTTSSSSFCRDMNWMAGVGNVIFNESASSMFSAYGSVVLQPTVTMNATIELRGSANTTVTINGSTAGTLQLGGRKTGSGVATIVDDWNSPTNGSITLTSGGLSLAGRTISVLSFVSVGQVTRTLDISNAIISTTTRWQYTGLNKFLVATGSYIISNQNFITNWQSGAPVHTYPKVDLTYAGTVNVFDINGTGFGELTFTSTSPTSVARIDALNTIRKLEFKGAGYFVGAGNIIDTLILAGSRNYSFSGSSTINKYLKAQSAACTGLIEMRGNLTGTLAFGNSAVVLIDNVYMQNMSATGSITPIAFNGADAGGNSGWTISSAAGSDRYWIGGSGDWNDPNHWSTTSGGAPGACIPTVNDNVFFDASSGFTAVSKTVSIASGNAYCHNIDWTGAPNAPIWSKTGTWNMEIWGDSIILNPTATFNTLVTAKGPTPAFLKGNVLGNFDFNIDKQGSSLTILNDYSNGQTTIGLIRGALNASGRRLTILQVDNSGGTANVFSIDISNSAIIAPFGWRFQGPVANHTLNAANSSITTGDFKAEGMQYDTVLVTGTINTDVAMNFSTINRLVFTNSATTSTVGINGNSNTLTYVEYKGSGGIYGTNNVMDTLVFFPGNSYVFNGGSNNTIRNEWFGSGTPCRLTEIRSTNSTNATITKTNGTAEFDYVRVQRITGAGTLPFIAREHSTDLGNNINWNILPYNGAAPIYGLGSDTVVNTSDFPIVLRTHGFFGSPSSSYTWNDGSTADSLVVNSVGSYHISVGFPDGCVVRDTITVTLHSTLPVTLTSFAAVIRNCEAKIDWETDNAVNFSHFVIERSNDGRNFTAIAQIPYRQSNYTYSDPVNNNKTIFYRLKMVDIDGSSSYSTVVAVRASCQLNNLKVYPTVTDNTVQVILPQGYEAARLELYNVSGQLMRPGVNGSGTVRNIELGSLPRAVYMLRVINGNNVTSFKIIKR